MNVQLDWQAGDETGKWETIATVTAHPRRNIPPWVWRVLVAALATFTVGGSILVHRWYQEAQRRIAFQIQSVIDLEARAVQRGDGALFMAQQDPTLPAWHAQQKSAGSAVARPAKVQDVTLRGDIAWVEVIAGQEPVRQVRFCRQTELGWMHTAPRAAFWGDPVDIYRALFWRPSAFSELSPAPQMSPVGSRS